MNTFLQDLSKEDRASLQNLLDDPSLPEDPVAAATETLGKLAEQGIVRQLDVLGARLKAPDLSDEEAAEIMQEIVELQRIRSEGKNS